MKKPEPKDFPPESPHDLEWGGYNFEKYAAALKKYQLWLAAKPNPDDLSLPEEEGDEAFLNDTDDNDHPLNPQ